MVGGTVDGTIPRAGRPLLTQFGDLYNVIKQSTYNKEDVCQILDCTCDEMNELFLKDVRKLLRQPGPHGRPWWQEESGLTFNHITSPLQWELLGQYPDQLQARQIPANLTRGSGVQRNAAWDAAHRRTNSRGETVLIPPVVSALDFLCKILKQEAKSIKKDKRLQKDNEVGLTPRKRGPKLTAPPHDANTATVARNTPRRKVGKVPLVKSVLTIVPEDQLVEFYSPNDLNEEARETLENAIVKIEFKDLVDRRHRLDRDEKGDIPIRNLRYDLIWGFLDNASLRTHRLEYITDDDAEEPSVVADNRDLQSVVDTVYKQQEHAIVDHVLVLAEEGGVDLMDFEPSDGGDAPNQTILADDAEMDDEGSPYVAASGDDESSSEDESSDDGEISAGSEGLSDDGASQAGDEADQDSETETESELDA